MTSRFFVERGVEGKREETCKACGLRQMCGKDRFVCINEYSDHYGHVLSEFHPACAAIRYRKEPQHVPIHKTRGGGVEEACEDAPAVAAGA
ncbi:MAG: hypothetical protein PVG49_16710 [Desulfobacteraceae bacterium]|jgi:hypothetical protein